MCGIAGALSFNETGKQKLQNITASVKSLRHRGPDFSDSKSFSSAALGHTRLSIIDTSPLSNQPFTDNSGRFHIVFNGEIFNYKALRNELEQGGTRFRSTGDVEVLLELYKRDGKSCLSKLNGFFAFAIFDQEENSFFMARDRFGVKPLYYFLSDDLFCFASEIKAVLSFGVHVKPDFDSLFLYLQLNYIPGQFSIFKEIIQLDAGCHAEIKKGHVYAAKYFELEKEIQRFQTGYSEKELRILLENSVRERLIADVPVGCFLSGGIDSTIIAGLAAQQTKNLSTFCLGFSGNKWFDESPYAETAAEALGTNHHTFMLSNDDLFSELENFLDSLDEPFADSSALNVYILSKKTKAHVKTVLSGDGADEVFGGYNKHRAEWLIRNSSKHRLFAGGGSLFSFLFPKSRNSGFANTMRQLEKFSAVMKLPAKERYWKMAGISAEEDVHALMKNFKSETSNERKKHFLSRISDHGSFNEFLLSDVNLVLKNDMLVKADRMSMCHGLEIRSPFLDWKVLLWGLGLDPEKKVNGKEGKIILKKTFSDLIPGEILVRKKHGFEVPLHKWMNNELKKGIEDLYLNDTFISDQNIFSLSEIKKLKQQLFSGNPGDAAARVWALIIFNHWYKKHSKYFA